jgi:hypothetical protein
VTAQIISIFDYEPVRRAQPIEHTAVPTPRSLPSERLRAIYARSLPPPTFVDKPCDT